MRRSILASTIAAFDCRVLAWLELARCRLTLDREARGSDRRNAEMLLDTLAVDSAGVNRRPFNSCIGQSGNGRGVATWTKPARCDGTRSGDDSGDWRRWLGMIR